MYGAILGDIIGSPYEFDRGNKSKDFPLFSQKSIYTATVSCSRGKCGHSEQYPKYSKQLCGP